MLTNMKALISAKAFQKLGLRGTHSQQKVFQYEAMKVKILPALSDNYMYLVRKILNGLLK